MRWILGLLQGIVVIYALFFAILNANSVMVNFLFIKQEISIAILSLLAFGVGMLLSFLAMVGPWLHHRYQHHILQRKLAKLEQKLSNQIHS